VVRARAKARVVPTASRAPPAPVPARAQARAAAARDKASARHTRTGIRAMRRASRPTMPTPASARTARHRARRVRPVRAPTGRSAARAVRVAPAVVRAAIAPAAGVRVAAVAPAAAATAVRAAAAEHHAAGTRCRPQQPRPRAPAHAAPFLLGAEVAGAADLSSQGGQRQMEQALPARRRAPRYHQPGRVVDSRMSRRVCRIAGRHCLAASDWRSSHRAARCRLAAGQARPSAPLLHMRAAVSALRHGQHVVSLLDSPHAHASVARSARCWMSRAKASRAGIPGCRPRRRIFPCTAPALRPRPRSAASAS